MQPLDNLRFLEMKLGGTTNLAELPAIAANLRDLIVEDMPQLRAQHLKPL